MSERSLTSEQRQRYARHLALGEVGPAGQQKLLRAKVLIVGVGALGSPVALYLAASGVGTIGLADHDHVRLSNLQRQIIHTMEGLNRSKVDGAARTVSALNPDIKVETIEATVDERNAMDLLDRYEVIVDGTDSFRARYLLSDAAYLLRKPLVHGSIFRIEGQVTVFVPGRGCYRCLYPEPPPAGAIEESENVGVFAALPGIIGTIQAAETIKLITGVGDGLVNRVLLHDTMAMTFREVRYRRNRACPVCGDHPTVHSLVDYDAFVLEARS
ncbi:MAG: molybdopterin-synthase adenylyltransferase MoeB [Chloroflexi bacterium]|jgi:adenylyltransferase/sulfurtransferase|nr:MAG: molybdopterin-synthase adenylyltransferase MoeB [Chloroflexota bacterium]